MSKVSDASPTSNATICLVAIGETFCLRTFHAALGEPMQCDVASGYCEPALGQVDVRYAHAHIIILQNALDMHVNDINMEGLVEPRSKEKTRNRNNNWCTNNVDEFSAPRRDATG